MSFQEKSTALMLVIMLVVYGAYFATIASRLGDTAVDQIPYQAWMLVTVVILVVLAIVGHIVVAVLPSYDGDESDERDRLVDLRGESFGGFVLGVGALGALLLAMAEFDHFWIANAILLALVLSEIVASVAKLALYRRMA